MRTAIQNAQPAAWRVTRVRVASGIGVPAALVPVSTIAIAIAPVRIAP